MKKRNAIVFATLLTMSMALAGSMSVMAKDTLVIGEQSDCGTLAPTGPTVELRSDINMQVYDGLFRFGYNMEATPGLATSWEQTDDTHITFHLREGVKYHDGRDFTAKDVLFSLKLCTEDANMTGVVTYLDFENCTAPDDYTVVLAFTTPNAFNFTKLASMNIVNEESYNESEDGMATHPVGTGAYKFDSSVPGVSYTLTANEEYWGGEVAGIKTVTFNVIAEGTQRTNALQAGEIDFNKNLQISDYEFVDGLEGYTVFKKPAFNTESLFFNMTENSPFQTKELRQAVAYAVDNNSMNLAGYNGIDIPATGVWSSGMSDYNAEWTNEMYGQDLEKAAELVTQAGAPAEPIRIIYGGSAAEETISQVLQAYLSQIGIAAEITSVDAGVFWSAMGDPTGWDIGIMSCSAPSGYGLDSMTAFLTGLNFQGWSGDNFEHLKELCTQGSSASTDEDRIAATKEIWELIEEEVPLYGMVYLTNMCAYDSNLQNYDCYDQFSFNIKDLSFAE